MSEQEVGATDRGEELAERSDKSREELLVAIEEATDALAEVVPSMNAYMSHDEIRPSAHRAFDGMQEAIHTLEEVDPTRTENGGSDE